MPWAKLDMLNIQLLDMLNAQRIDYYYSAWHKNVVKIKLPTMM